MNDASMVAILNTIRDNASEGYQQTVPVATEANLQAVGNPILAYVANMNEFLNALVNKVAMTIVSNRSYNNPLAPLKRGMIPLGKDVEEVFTNPATAEAYDIESTVSLLARTTPDVKAAYHRMNRQDVYPTTISNQALRQAFTSWSSLESLIASIVNSLYSGDNIDEFKLMKTLYGTAVNSGYIVKNYLGYDVTNETTGVQFTTAIKKVSGAMQFPGNNFNSYKQIATAQGVSNVTDVTTWTPKERQILLIRSDILAVLDVNVLAFAFNMDKAQFLGRVVEVDNFGEFGEASNVAAILADEGWSQVYDNLVEMGEFYNAKSLSWNYFYHHWQTYSYSPFANAVAFIIGEGAPAISTSDLPDGTVNANYQYALTASGAQPITFAVTAGSLTDGLTLSSNGIISGKPTVASESTFTVTATNSEGSSTAQLTLKTVMP